MKCLYRKSAWQPIFDKTLDKVEYIKVFIIEGFWIEWKQKQNIFWPKVVVGP